jgi:hypothetical protein
LQFFTALVRSRVDPEYGVINATDKDILGIFIVPDESGAESHALIAISDKFLSDTTKNPLHDRDLSLISDFVGEFFSFNAIDAVGTVGTIITTDIVRASVTHFNICLHTLLRLAAELL